MRSVIVFAFVLACADPVAPSTDDVGREVHAPAPRRTNNQAERMFDAHGVPLESDQRVAGLTLPRGLTEQPELSAERRHIYYSSVPRAPLLRYFGPRLMTNRIDERGEAVTYVDAVPREARGGIVRMDVSILPSSAHEARVEIYERLPPREGVQVSEEVIRRHLDSLTKNRE